MIGQVPLGRPDTGQNATPDNQAPSIQIGELRLTLDQIPRYVGLLTTALNTALAMIKQRDQLIRDLTELNIELQTSNNTLRRNNGTPPSEDDPRFMDLTDEQRQALQDVNQSQPERIEFRPVASGTTSDQETTPGALGTGSNQTRLTPIGGLGQTTTAKNPWDEAVDITP